MTLRDFNNLYNKLSLEYFNTVVTLNYLNKPVTFIAKACIDNHSVTIVTPWIEFLCKSEAEDIIKHEFVHLILGHSVKQYHGYEFRNLCKQMGCTPRAKILIKRASEYERKLAKLPKSTPSKNKRRLG